MGRVSWRCSAGSLRRYGTSRCRDGLTVARGRAVFRPVARALRFPLAESRPPSRNRVVVDGPRDRRSPSTRARLRSIDDIPENGTATLAEVPGSPARHTCGFAARGHSSPSGRRGARRTACGQEGATNEDERRAVDLLPTIAAVLSRFPTEHGASETVGRVCPTVGGEKASTALARRFGRLGEFRATEMATCARDLRGRRS